MNMMGDGYPNRAALRQYVPLAKEMTGLLGAMTTAGVITKDMVSTALHKKLKIFLIQALYPSNIDAHAVAFTAVSRRGGGSSRSTFLDEMKAFARFTDLMQEPRTLTTLELVRAIAFREFFVDILRQSQQVPPPDVDE